MNACTAIVGINWGDEGKGRMVDLLTEAFDVVIRYQGGANAGHTVINQFGEFEIHALPSGIFRKGVVNVIGNGVALDPEMLLGEIRMLQEKGVSITPENLMISERASLLLPWHRKQETLEEERLQKLGEKQFGSSRLGIGPFYADKHLKKTILAGELFYPEIFHKNLENLRIWKNLELTGVYGADPVTEEELDAWVKEYCEPLKPFIADTRTFLLNAQNENKRILFEAQMGALRDLDFGVYPYTTSSNVLASYAPVGSGMPGVEIDRIIGVVKSYSTCVGKGHFVSELQGEEARKMREACRETDKLYHRIGPMDLVATRYGVKVQAATEIALTKLDVLGALDEIPVCVRYRYKDKEYEEMPFPSILSDCEPVYEMMKGWKCDISGVRNWWDLPEEAQNYVKRIEEATGVVIKWISVGPERHSIIRRGQT